MSPASKKKTKFCTFSHLLEKETGLFYPEYCILLKTADSVNSLFDLYKTGRSGAKGGPSTHDQQDLYRAMLVFACAGLDVFVKKMVTDKLPQLLSVDKEAEKKFGEFVQKDLKAEKITNVLALALINPVPRNVFIAEYIKFLVGESLQSAEAIHSVLSNSGIEIGPTSPFNKPRMSKIKEAFIVRNEIIHEMDINIQDGAARTTAYRTRRVRKAGAMEEHTQNILRLAEDILKAYKEKFEKYKVGFKKEHLTTSGTSSTVSTSVKSKLTGRRSAGRG